MNLNESLERYLEKINEEFASKYLRKEHFGKHVFQEESDDYFSLKQFPDEETYEKAADELAAQWQSAEQSHRYKDEHNFEGSKLVGYISDARDKYGDSFVLFKILNGRVGERVVFQIDSTFPSGYRIKSYRRSTIENYDNILHDDYVDELPTHQEEIHEYVESG